MPAQMIHQTTNATNPRTERLALNVGPTLRYLERLRNFEMTKMEPGTTPPKIPARIDQLHRLDHRCGSSACCHWSHRLRHELPRRPVRAAPHRVAHRPVLQRPTGNPFQAQLDSASAGWGTR